MMNKPYYIGTSRRFTGFGIMFKIDPPYTTVRRSWLFELQLGWLTFWYVKEKKHKAMKSSISEGGIVKGNPISIL